MGLAGLHWNRRDQSMHARFAIQTQLEYGCGMRAVLHYRFSIDDEGAESSCRVGESGI